MPAPVRLLGLPGSLRRASHSTAVLRTLAERCPPDVVIDLHDLRAVPLYDQDLDGEAPPGRPRAQGGDRGGRRPRRSSRRSTTTGSPAC